MSPTDDRSRTDDKRQIVVLNRDVFFGVKIGNTLRGLGFGVDFVKTTAELVARLHAIHPPPSLAVIDMNAGVDWDAVRALTSDDGPGVPVLVFGSHLDVDGFRAAKAAGVARVVSNGDFHRDMVGLVERYAHSRA